MGPNRRWDSYRGRAPQEWLCRSSPSLPSFRRTSRSGLVIGCKLTCTKHLWSWDLETLELQDEAELPLKTYDVKVEDDNIMVYVTEQLEYAFDEDEDIDESTFFDDDDDDDEW